MEMESTEKALQTKLARQVSSEIAGDSSSNFIRRKTGQKNNSFDQFQLLSIQEGSLWVADVARAIKSMMGDAIRSQSQLRDGFRDRCEKDFLRS